MDLSPATIGEHLPYYLTAAQKDGLINALNQFPNCNYYNNGTEGLLQGDGWTGLQILRFEDGERKNIKGILLSNTCDIAVENKRDIPARVNFAPIVSLQNFRNLLLKSGLSKEKIDAKFDGIKKQLSTTIFYLPKNVGVGLEEDYIANFDDIHTLPLHWFLSNEDKKGIFKLSQVGFYLFLMKLSIHFCRMHEGVNRETKS